MRFPKYLSSNPLLLPLGATALVLALCVASCAPLKPYRTKLAPVEAEQAIDCSPDLINATLADRGQVAEACGQLMVERTAKYDLHFAEFDDQGFSYEEHPEHGHAYRQMDDFLDEVRHYADEDNLDVGGASVIVFVHGWKHTSRSDDENVKAFRILLSGLSSIEADTFCGRKVIGLYVGWRGAGTRLPDPLENLTFWTRKNAALNVAQGSVREALSSLRAVADLNNATWKALVEKARLDRNVDVRSMSNACAKRMRLTVVGHSFGGLIVHSALSQAMVRDMAELREAILAGEKAADDRDPILNREGDLIVLINPAIEAARFDPLHRIARKTATVNYHSPLLIAITSTDDQATRIAFPIGRWLRSLFDHHPKGADHERIASLKTMGQDSAYITHTLQTWRQSVANYEVTRIEPRCEAVTDQDFSYRLTLEAAMMQEFDGSLRRSRDANQVGVFPRMFCARQDPGKRGPADHQLVLDKATSTTNLNSPVWNVRTSHPIVNDHGDMMNVKLIDFLRQMYAEAANPRAATLLNRPVIAAAEEE